MHESTPYNSRTLKNVFSNIIFKAGLVVYCIIFPSFSVKVDDELIEINLDLIVSYDNVPIDFVVNNYLSFETDVIITESQRVYINIEDLFRNLGIKCISENNGNNLTGFIENESKRYNIDFNAKEIKVGNKKIRSKNGIIEEDGVIYIESTVIAEAFGLNAIFNFRSLSIKMEANFELPMLKQMRIEQMRQNVSKLQDQDIIADTILGRDYHILKLGVVDWSVASYQTQNRVTNNRFVLGSGAELLYGQANVSVYYDEKYKFDKRQLYYNWRWVDNEKSAVKQAQLGKVYGQSIAYLDAPLVGTTVSNTPTTVRKATGFYTISEHTDPNWTVELYINGVLIDYTVADASGLYTFQVPIVFGYTTLQLKFYGPMGEERIEERTINVPFTFIPAKTLEYNFTAGILQDTEGSMFGKGALNYGVNRHVSIGGGLEYLSSIANYPYIPFATIAFQPLSSMVLNFDYAHNVKTRGLLNFNFGKSAFLEIDYADFVDGQLATRFNANEELKVRVSLPFKMNKLSGYTKINYNQYSYSTFKYNQFDATFSGYYQNYSANLATLLNWIDQEQPYVTSILSLSYHFRNGFVLRPLAEYNISYNQFLRYKLEIEKRVAKAYFSVSYEKNMAYNSDNLLLNFRYDLKFARTSISGSYLNNNYYFTEDAQGSIAFGDKTIKGNNTSSLGKGGILFYPFLDINQNGELDKGEQMVLLSKVRVSGGKAIISKKDSIIRVSDLNAFVNYYIEFSENDLANISWRFKHKTYQILVDPNQYKRVNVPIISLGEISGMVYLNKNKDMRGIGRITIEILDKQGRKVAETLSERDGYYSYLGLSPYEYTVRIDEEQLAKLGYQSVPRMHNAPIKASIDGDILEGLDFMLEAKEEMSELTSVQQITTSRQQVEITLDSGKIISAANTEASIVTNANPEALFSNDSIDFTVVETPAHKNADYILIWGDICDKPGNYYVQCGAFRKKSNALNYALKIKQATDLTMGVILTDNYYKVQVECIDNKTEAIQFKKELIEQLSVSDIFINEGYNKK